MTFTEQQIEAAAKAVGCPTCYAFRGKPCRAASGPVIAELGYLHIDRIESAEAALTAAFGDAETEWTIGGTDPDGTEWIVDVSHYEAVGTDGTREMAEQCQAKYGGRLHARTVTDWSPADE